jgi:two-component system, NtrC family, response regulator AtoC
MKQKIKILLADDDPILRRLLPFQLSAAEFETIAVESGKKALEMLTNRDFDVVLLDVNLPDASGLEILQTIKQTEDSPEVVMLTADVSLKTGIEAMRRGAYEYITKPAIPEQVEIIVRKAVEKRVLIQQNARLRVVVKEQTKDNSVTPIHLNSLMTTIYSQAEMVAKIDTTVLITGESGTGKDVLARWIHNKSPRSDLPMVSINCGALPENLFESEFFGHEKGSFTGANAQKIGLLEAADNSTLFLDEIGEMPLAIQVKLLHFLENGSFRRVGATRDRNVDARIIAATNRPLEQDIASGQFRSDLFYRLNVVSFHIPPLRERTEDISALVDYFINTFKVRFNRQNLQVSDEARKLLETYEWKGNIRELKNTLERAIVFSESDLIEEIYGLKTKESQNVSKNTSNLLPSSKVLSLAEVEKIHILEILSQVGGKREKAASLLGITSRTLYRKLREFENLQ